MKQTSRASMANRCQAQDDGQEIEGCAEKVFQGGTGNRRHHASTMATSNTDLHQTHQRHIGRSNLSPKGLIWVSKSYLSWKNEYGCISNYSTDWYLDHISKNDMIAFCTATCEYAQPVHWDGNFLKKHVFPYQKPFLNLPTWEQNPSCLALSHR